MNTPPQVRRIPTLLEKHGHTRIDNYFWLRERDNPEVLQYLRDENAYTEAMMAPAKNLQDLLYTEITGRIKQTDLSVPYRQDDYLYYTRYEQGKEYALHCRKGASRDAREEVMIDGNLLALGYGYFNIGSTAVSFRQDLLAFTVDTVGRRIYTIRFKDLVTGAMLPDAIPSTTANIAWANDNRTLFYAKQDSVTLRPYRIYRHTLGTNVADDTLVFEEKDETFSCSVFRTRSKQYLMIASHQTVSAEYHYLDANNAGGTFKVVSPREKDHEYFVDHLGGFFYIRTNLKATNFRLMRTPVNDTRISSWRDVIVHRRAVLLEDFELFNNHLVLTERKNGLRLLRVLPWSGPGEHYVAFPEQTYHVALEKNPSIDTHFLRFTYESLTTPKSVFDYDMGRRTRTLLKEEEVVGGYDPTQYHSERVFAKATDGALVPISLVYKQEFVRDGSRPLLLHGYGSYGISTEPTFSSARLSLLDRGFVYAIAHVRGGEELGRVWYEDGKLLKKKNTFSDFVTCAEYVIRERYTGLGRLFATGRSAGGLLMGAVVNMAPHLFAGVVTSVPFVDVVTTMLDDTIPLTTSEYDEWGNPNLQRYYEYMLSYSPYDNVEAKEYPNLFVLTGLHDSQVQYWEPAKWVAKLRALKTDSNLLLLHTNMQAGHGGSSGRFRRLRETAMEYAFLLRLAGITQ